jgi:oligopeptide transport system permease protein
MDIQRGSEKQIEEPVAAGLFELELEAPAVVESGDLKKTTASPFQESLQRLRRDKRAMVSLITLVVILLFSLFFPIVYQHIGDDLRHQVAPGYVLVIPPTQYHSPDYQDSTRIINNPSSLHWLGTDDNGQDILARLMQGWQVSLLVAIAVEIQDVIFGVFFGVLAGYFGGVIDTLLSRFTDLMFAFPGLLFAILVTAIFGAKFSALKIGSFSFGPYGRLVLAVLVIGLIVWPQMARYVRAQTLQLKEQQFIEAARTTGTSSFKIITRHILPNIAGLIIIVATLNMSGTVVAEGVLSLLGLGAQPPGSSLGLMISQYSPYLQVFPYEMLFPIICLVILVLAFSFVGDGLRDAFDPRTKD